MNRTAEYRGAITDITSTVGNTPLIRLGFRPEGAEVYAKCEFLNPSGSIKDRLARTVVDDAERRHLLTAETTILECSSGNTGVAFAMLGAARGYKVAIVLAEHASRERRQLIEHFGAKVFTFAGDNYWAGVELTRKMAADDPRYFLPRQFENPLNAEDHEHATGVEMLDQVPGSIGAFVAGYGTGGTLAGVSAALRKNDPSVEVYAMEPAEAALLLGETSCCHRIEGVADGFVPPLMRSVRLDGVIKVTSADATRMAQRLATEFGLLVGISSGANVAAALELARRPGRRGLVVTLLCDRAERYFSTALFSSPSGATP